MQGQIGNLPLHRYVFQKRTAFQQHLDQIADLRYRQYPFFSHAFSSILFRKEAQFPPHCRRKTQEAQNMPLQASQAQEQAHRLFACLREMDAQDDLVCVYARMPQKSEVGLAVWNRLAKAAGFEVIKL